MQEQNCPNESKITLHFKVFRSFRFYADDRHHLGRGGFQNVLMQLYKSLMNDEVRCGLALTMAAFKYKRQGEGCGLRAFLLPPRRTFEANYNE